ncbi:hypothetical protein Tco_1198320 [Tanacetum coccineum]
MYKSYDDRTPEHNKEMENAEVDESDPKMTDDIDVVKCVHAFVQGISVTLEDDVELVESPLEHPKDKPGLDASAKLTRAKLNKHSGDADLSKDKLGPESPLEFWRSWRVEGHVRSRVISFVLAQWYLRTTQQSQDIKAIPRKLAYADFDKEAPALSLAKGFSDRFSLKSSGTSDTYKQTRSASKSQKTPSKNKESTHLRRSRRLEDQNMTKEKVRKKRSKPERKGSGHQEASSSSEYEEGSEDAYEDLNSLYKRTKSTPFTQRITRFKYHMRAKLPWNIRVYEGNKDPEDHLGILSAVAEQDEWPMPVLCKMFCETLGGAERNWFDDLNPKSVDSFEELSQKFLEEFSQ